MRRPAYRRRSRRPRCPGIDGRTHRIGETPKLEGENRGETGQRGSAHTYLRLPSGARHPVLRGFDDTDILPFGGLLSPLRVDSSATVPLTFVPAFPTYPPETAWMRQPATDTPGLILSEHGQGRVAYMPADVGRRYANEHLPDHAALLGSVVRWAAGGRIPLAVEGPGLLDCHLYQQTGRIILHVVNLTSESTWRAPLDELIRVGPITVKIRLAPQRFPRMARLRCCPGRALRGRDWCRAEGNRSGWTERWAS